MGNKPQKGGSSKKESIKAKKGASKEPQLADFASSTHFSEVEVNKLYKTFTELAPSGRVNKELFGKCLERLEEHGFKHPKDTPFGDRLFQLLDINNDGVVDLNEFVCGLSMLCKGTTEEKLALSFKAYDLDGNGSISEEEMKIMFKQAWLAGFKALAFDHGGEDLDFEQLDEFSTSMAQNFAHSAFETLDTDKNGQLSLEEFTKFVMAQPKITATLNGFKHEVNIVLP